MTLIQRNRDDHVTSHKPPLDTASPARKHPTNLIGALGAAAVLFVTVFFCMWQLRRPLDSMRLQRSLEKQGLVFRPVFPWFRYRTPVAGVYLGSSYTHPGAGIHGMCGWNAAGMALQDAAG